MQRVSEIGVEAFCRGILERGDLEAKLTPQGLAAGDPGAEERWRGSPAARAPELALVSGAPPLPRPGQLGDPALRARCLARFAHHELQAVELFAWALLRWPEMPPGLSQALLSVLEEEQAHCRLYLGRLADHGSTLSEHPLSDYFWRQVPVLDAAPQGIRAFLCGMGLTLEQANLDFTLLYRDAFAAAGDRESARVCERVHEEERGHVGLAMGWLRRLDGGGRSDVELYEAAVPFPLSAARAKGRHFRSEARRQAGLGEDLIEHVRRARSAQELAGSAP